MPDLITVARQTADTGTLVEARAVIRELVDELVKVQGTRDRLDNELDRYVVGRGAQLRA